MPKPVPKESSGTEPLLYTGKVTTKGTGKPVRGATVVVRRSGLTVRENKILQETKHETDREGKYSFTIPPEQAAEPALYIELDVEHPDYAPQKNFGYSLAMIRKNEQLGGRPFFENVELYPGDSITGRVQTPDGKPAVGVEVKAYSRSHATHLPEYGSFVSATTDEDGGFRLTLIKGGSAILWLLPEKFAPSAQPLKKRGDLGRFVLQPGISFRGKVRDTEGRPRPGVWVNAQLVVQQIEPEILQLSVVDAIRRSALTNEEGEFEMAPLPPGTYQIRLDDSSHNSSRDDHRRQSPPAVFVSQRITLREGETPHRMEIRAVPNVVIEAQYVDSDGKPRSGHEVFLCGTIDATAWHTMGCPDANGKITIHAPRGLENAALHLSTNEHSALRCQIHKDGPLSNLTRVPLGTLEGDLREIRIIRYRAPILLVNALDKGGRQIHDFQVQALYTKGKSPREPNAQFINWVQGDVYFEKQEDGRWRSFQLLPDERITITTQADGYEPRSETLQLSEGERKELEVVLEAK